jgi:hypothetical protein
MSLLLALLTVPAIAGVSPQISPEELERLPFQLGHWAGQESPLDEAVVPIDYTDVNVSRKYSRQNPPESVWLYIIYGVSVRDLMPHRPDIRYMAGGWTLTDRNTKDLDLTNGNKLPCNVWQLSRGTLNKERVAVLYYYIVNGEYCCDFSLLRSKARRGEIKVDNVVQVEIVAPVAPNLSANSAEGSVQAFAVESAASMPGIKMKGYASAPSEPHNDRRLLFTSIALGLCLIVGSGIVFLRQKRMGKTSKSR